MTALVSDALLTKKQARAITDKINAKTGEIWALLQNAHDGKAWEALGYKSWRDYATTEFSVSQSRAYQLLDQARVVTAIQDAANSTNVEISEATARKIKPVVNEVVAEIKAKVEKGADPIQTTYEVIEAKRVETKPAPEPETPKPAPKPTKTQEPEVTIESLQTENAALREEISVLRDNNRELASLLESYDAVTEGEHKAAMEMATVRGQLRTVEAIRDQYMTTCSELRKEVKALQNKIKRGEK